MPHLHSNPALPDTPPPWDITFSRLARTTRPEFESCTADLKRRFLAIGLSVETQIRPTPRGQSTFLALVGERGLICILEITLIDGMLIGKGPCAIVDIRLLDACGDVVADHVTDCLQSLTGLGSPPAKSLPSVDLGRAATAIYVSALAHFDLLRHASKRI